MRAHQTAARTRRPAALAAPPQPHLSPTSAPPAAPRFAVQVGPEDVAAPRRHEALRAAQLRCHTPHHGTHAPYHGTHTSPRHTDTCPLNTAHALPRLHQLPHRPRAPPLRHDLLLRGRLRLRSRQRRPLRSACHATHAHAPMRPPARPRAPAGVPLVSARRAIGPVPTGSPSAPPYIVVTALSPAIASPAQSPPSHRPMMRCLARPFPLAETERP